MDSSTWWAAIRDRLPNRPAVAAVAVGVVASALVAAAAVVLLRTPRGPTPQLSLPVAGADPAGGASPGPAGATATTAATATVHAAGAVASPGVYAVATGSRVADVVTAAGGPLPEADVTTLNLAARVADGDRIYVPRQGELSPTGPSGGGAGTGAGGGAGGGAPGTAARAGPLDLNAATAEELDALPGVGPATARSILTYRTRHGRFRSVNELLEVPGIGPSKLETLRPLVKV